MSLALARVKTDNRFAISISNTSGDKRWLVCQAWKSFRILEDKIYRTIELTKTLRQEKENLEKELSLMHRDMGSVLERKRATRKPGREATRRT